MFLTWNRSRAKEGPHLFQLARWIFLSVLILCAATLFSAGCAFHWPLRGDASFQPPQPLPVGYTKSELVQKINENVGHLHSWRSTDLTLSAKGPGTLPIKLSGEIAVESPRNFRLMVHSLAGTETDFGSNSERFWFWMKRGEPKHVFTARHDGLTAAQRRMMIPFHPDWVMQAMGVIPLLDSQVEMEIDETTQNARLITKLQSPDGHPMQSVIVADPSGVIHSHQLFDQNHRLVARANLSNYQRHEPNDIIFPHEITLHWPQSNLKLIMKVNAADLNPSTLSANIWQLPEIPDSPRLDIDRVPAAQHTKFHH